MKRKAIDYPSYNHVNDPINALESEVIRVHGYAYASGYFKGMLTQALMAVGDRHVLESILDQGRKAVKELKVQPTRKEFI